MHPSLVTPSFHLPLAFGIPSGPDLIILLVIVLVLFGAKRLPELARGLGQSVNEFKKAKDEFDKEVAKSGTSNDVPKAEGSPNALPPQSASPTDSPTSSGNPRP
jgi:TatA/E family protein of Tat protein translocase